MSLHHTTILDLSHGLATQLGSLHLADQGARIIHIPSARPDPRQLGLTHRHKMLHVPHDASQRAALIDALLPRVDLVIEDAQSSLLSPSQRSVMRAHGVLHAHLPDFDPHDPRARPHARPLPHGALDAFMGLYEVPLGRRPVSHHLSLLDVTCAASFSCAILAALYARDHHGTLHDISLARAEVAYPLLELNAMFTHKPPSSWHTLTWAATPFIASYRCKDGEFIYLHAGLSHHLAALLDCLRALDPGHHRMLRDALSARTLEEPTCVESMIEHHHIIGALERLFLDRSAADWEQILSAHGLCAVRMRTLDDWCAPDAHASKTQHLFTLAESGQKVPGPAARHTLHPPHEPSPVTLLDTAEQVLEAFPDRRAARHYDASPQLGPLHGVRVLDLTHVIAGPTSTRQLAELGADVLRIENPHFNAPWVHAFHIAYNAGKRGVTLDLMGADGKAEFIKILEEFQPDIIAMNLRPGAGSSSHLAEDQVRAHCPRIIYAHMTAYGHDGPWGDRPGWEQTAQAVTGVQLDWGADSGVPDLFPLPFNDLCTGLHGTQAMLLALLARVHASESFQGAHVSTSLAQTSLWMQARVLCGLATPQRGKKNLGAGPLERFYRTKDGWGYLVVHNLEALYVVQGLERLQGARGKALEMSLEAELATQSFATWQKRFARAGIRSDELAWVARRTQKEVLSDAHAHAEGLVHRRAHPGVGLVTETGSPLKINGQRPALGPAPTREHIAHDEDPAKRLPWLVAQARGALAMGLTKRRKS